MQALRQRIWKFNSRTDPLGAEKLSDVFIDIFGLKFKVSESLIHSDVKAVIITSIGTLQSYLGNELVESFEYRLSAERA